jgi:hypothetical protein
LGVVTVFGCVGGILSRQARKEAAHLIAMGATEGTARPTARSMRLYGANKEMGFRSFEDCIATQRMATNVNKDSAAAQKESREERAKDRPVATTVQTVTTTVSGSASATQSKGSWNPFSDILDRTERKKEDK